MAAPDIRMLVRLLGGSGFAGGNGGWFGVGVGGRVAVTPAAVLGSGGVVGTNAPGFCSPVVGIVVMVFGRGATVGGIALGLMDEICCWVVLMELLFFVKSPVYVVMKVHAAAMVRYCGAGCRGTGFVGGTLLPFALDKLALVVVNSSMESMTQV